MQKKAAGMLALFLIISVILYPMGVNAANRQDDSRFRIRITVGDQDFSAELYDNETTRAWVGQMPMTLEMSELNGNEKYHYFSESLPTNPKRPDAIHTGDLMLYGQSCLVLFYKDFVTSYSYTPLGYMEDATGLAQALENGNVTVSFRLDDGELPDGKEELWKLYDEEKAISNQGYTAQSWLAFEDALETAKNTLGDQNATTKNVQDAITGLENAKKGLVTLESVLEKEILNYSKADSDGDNYTEQPEQKQVKVRAIKLTGNVVKLAKGRNVKLNAVISPANASDKGLKWTSSDKKVAAVTADGSVTGKKKGTAIITATAMDGSGIKGIYKITVMPHAVKKISLFLLNGNKVSQEGIVLNSKTKSITVGKKVKISVTVSATGKMANKKLVWSTSNKKYATVNANGKVTAKKAGKGKTVLITAKATDGSGKKASIKIRIKS